MDPVQVVMGFTVVLGVGWLVRQLMRITDGPETRSHTPPLGKQPCCDGVPDDGLAEWWESYGELTIRLGSGAIFRRYRRDSEHRLTLLGRPWEPYPELVPGNYPEPVTPHALLDALEARIVSGDENGRRNTPLNGWHW